MQEEHSGCHRQSTHSAGREPHGLPLELFPVTEIYFARHIKIWIQVYIYIDNFTTLLPTDTIFAE